MPDPFAGGCIYSVCDARGNGGYAHLADAGGTFTAGDDRHLYLKIIDCHDPSRSQNVGVPEIIIVVGCFLAPILLASF